MNNQPFDAGAAFAYLDSLKDMLDPSAIVSADAAWDAAWVVCMSESSTHERAAWRALADLVADIERMNIALTQACVAGLYPWCHHD